MNYIDDSQLNAQARVLNSLADVVNEPGMIGYSNGPAPADTDTAFTCEIDEPLRRQINPTEELNAQARGLHSPTGELNFNANWMFCRCDAESAFESDPAIALSDYSWTRVCLPHTPRLEAYNERFPWQGICWYYKEFQTDAWAGKRVALNIGAAMLIADIWINGVHKCRHLGGYLPIYLDITGDLYDDKPNVIAIRLDNRDTTECPPGKPTSDLDFQYAGGLYRGASLIITNPVHMSNPVAAGIPAGGGVFVTYDNVSAEHAVVNVKTHVVNDSNKPARYCRIVTKIINHKNAVVTTSQSEPVMIPGGSGHEFKTSLEMVKPMLWHPDRPYLYTLETTILQDGDIVDSVSTSIGIRHIKIGKRFYLNGSELHLCGTNRHQDYPVIGNALSPAAQYRDAVKIKEAGFNFVRLSHYPQDPSFLNACDELGLLVQAPIPGWQIFHNNNSFVETSLQNIRDLIRRDRNHPCIVIWEPNFNETDGDHTDWCRAAYEIAHAEYPGDQCYTFGDDYPGNWAGWDIKGLRREYGDWNFGGNQSTSRRTRSEGEGAALQQAWNYQWTLNYLNKSFDDPNVTFIGCANWVMFDHNRGYYHLPNYCGTMDSFRIPKFVYRFYQSQRNPAMIRPEYNSGPMVWIASQWSERLSPAKVVVFSNCDEVELFVNGVSIERRVPDNGPDTPYSDRERTDLATIGEEFDLSGGNPFDGGNALHLEHPPFTFMDVPYENGRITAIGYHNGVAAAIHEVHTPEEPAGLRLEIDTAGIDLVGDGADTVFIHAHIIDRNGTTVPDASCDIHFDIDGPAHIIGQNPACIDGGIASALLRAGELPGIIHITAVSVKYGSATASIQSKNP